MTGTDRAFRALAQHDPSALGSLLHALLPERIPGSPQIRGEDLQPTRLEALAPSEEADWIGQVGPSLIAPLYHVESQGYGDKMLLDRVFFYHLVTVVRNRGREVHSLVLWLRRPSAEQRQETLQRGDLTLRLRSFVLPEMDASVLLADDDTACFAAACDPGPLSFEELCGRVCDALVRTGASWYRRHMAAVCALSQGRLHVMVEAMEQRSLEPVIIEDLVKYGQDLGFDKGFSPLVKLFSRKLGRPLSLDELTVMTARLESLGAERIGDIAFEFDGVTLAAWLADPNAT